MADVFFPDEAKVWVIAAGTAAPSSGTELTSYATNFTESGGGRDTESIPVFGGGNITKENPREQYEVSFDVVVQPATAMLFDEMLYGTTLTGTTTPQTSSGEGQDLKFEIIWDDGTNTYSRIYNNVKVTAFTPELGADEYLKGSVSFKMSPTTQAGVGNLTIAHT